MREAGGIASRFLSRCLATSFSDVQITTRNIYVKDQMTYTHERTLTEQHTEYNNTNTRCRCARLLHYYVEAPPKLVRACNPYHSSIKRAPADVSATNQEDACQTLYGQPHGTLHKGHRRPKMKEGDRVRISRARRPFKKC